MSAASPVAIGEILADKYRIDRILGEGGMGVVVAAHHLELDQPVAIKFLLDDVANSTEGAERFRREARAAARIQSDHVVRVLDVGVLPAGARYMVMEYLDGRDLSEELQQRGRFEVAEAVGYVLEALDAIGQAHASGIVHRDLKPANLYLARRADGSSRVKVLDFGISKSLSAASSEQLSLTRTSAWMGSPLYMAPEQMQSARDVDGRADIWSVGAILYELISGQPPYPAESLPQLCNLLLTQDPAPLSSVRSDVPPEVEAVVARCLARKVDARWQTVPDLVAALLETGVAATRGSLPGARSVSANLAATEVGGSLAPQAGGLTATEQRAAPARTAGGFAEPGSELGPELASPTQGAWDRTNTASGAPKRVRVWLAVVGLGALAAVGALLLASGPAGTDETTSAATPEGAERLGTEPQAPRGSQPIAAPTTTPADAATGEPSAEAEPRDPEPEEPTPKRSDSAGSAAEKGPAASTAPKSTTPKATAPKNPSSSRPAPPPPTPNPPRSPSDGGISDFGGRR